METAKIGKRGTLVIPAKLRQRFALKEGDLLVTEVREDGILLRPAVAVPVEIYTPQRMNLPIRTHPGRLIIQQPARFLDENLDPL